MRLERASIIAVFGASGSGKSYKVKRLIARDARLLVWDPMDEYRDAGCDRIEGDLRALVQAVRAKRWRIAYVPDFRALAEQFAYVCRIVRAAGKCRFVAEELNEVTRPSYAPPEWKWLCSRGRHRGIRIIGVSQRPASVDKDFIGNATEGWAGRLPYERDWQALAPVLGREAAKLANLPPRQFLHWGG